MSRSYATAPEMNMPFHGAKIALLADQQILVILRDDRPDIPYPDHWDLPGGGREGDETPVACALRETKEELGLTIRPEAICWGRRFVLGDQANWFFVAPLAGGAVRDIRFGDEGQGWRLMTQTRFLRHPKAVPRFQVRLRLFRDQGGRGKTPR